NSRSNIVTSILILIVGVVFIFMQSRGDVINAIVVIMGILFIAAAVLNLLMMMYSSRKNTQAVVKRDSRASSSNIPTLLASVAAIALGIWMIVDPEALVSIIVYIFAGLLVLGGAYHIYMLAYGYRPQHFPGWMYVFPSALLIAGIVILVVGAPTITDYIVLITGIAMVIFSVSSFLEYAGQQTFNRKELQAHND
ncbi:MAG: DUF308 domain-containing protein, partial [Muribaculaceae bacterium]|nr:DUF308 domain-containing protein [Muribaculaceae bacterium]